jgi:hypothetical protein
MAVHTAEHIEAVERGYELHSQDELGAFTPPSASGASYTHSPPSPPRLCSQAAGHAVVRAAALRHLVAPHGWGSLARREGTPASPMLAPPPGKSQAWPMHIHPTRS